MRLPTEDPKPLISASARVIEVWVNALRGREDDPVIDRTPREGLKPSPTPSTNGDRGRVA